VTSPLLDSLAPDDRDRILGTARRRHFKHGEVVFHEGDLGDSLHLVDSGIFAVQVSAPSGDAVTLNVLAAGDFFGELALLHGEQRPRRTATVIALAPAQTLTVSGTDFAALRSARPSVERLVVAALAHRVDQLSTRLLEALYVGVDRRVYRRLLELAETCRSSSPHSTIPLSQSDLASMAGASRPTVNQVLQKLESRGIVTLGRREITIVDIDALRAAAPRLEG
jgi:CRP/FNR family transcriptional regulator, cyclic AMP receptor protein